LDGIQAVLNGRNCFVRFVSPTQINVLTPPDTATGPVDVDVVTRYGTAATTVNMQPVSPAWFTYSLQGALHLIAQFAGESVYVAEEGALPETASRPAKSGDFLQLYATGLGSTTPPYPAGQVLTTIYPIANPGQLSVSVGGLQAQVLFAGMTYAGVFQVNIRVPEGIPEGDLQVILRVGDWSTQTNALLSFTSR
jgi:uncharacterized protein (TIGR03437 family)